jgi:flagellar motor switch protein FliN/FliY
MTEGTETGNSGTETPVVDPAAQMTESGEAEAPAVHPAEFPAATPGRSPGSMPLERFSDVQVEIAVEIGRVTMSIGDLLNLGHGSVVELNRSLTEPVSIMAQGVLIASGEVVVVDDRFAVRITEIAKIEDLGTVPSAETSA